MRLACEERVAKYIRGLREALAGLEGLGVEYSRLLDAARRYTDDAEYYLNAGDCETALVAASYAEGLVDALKYLGVVEPAWPSQAREDVDRRVFVAGTFDILHPGHVELFRFASRHGKVYVVVARDSTVVRVKGKKPLMDEETRRFMVSAVRYVREALLGDERDMLASVGRVRPHVIVLGPDQPFEEEWLAAEVERRFGFRPLVVRFRGKREFAGGLKSTTDIYRRVCREVCPWLEGRQAAGAVKDG